MYSWQNPLLSLRERCMLFSENEYKNGIKEDKPNSYTSTRIKEYFSICTRIVNGKEEPIKLSSGNWCSSGGCFAMYSSLLPGEIPPHGYRVGVVEVVSDLQKNKLWHDINEVRKEDYTISEGDVIVFDRSNPNNPESKWFRHFGRVYSIHGDSFQCISGNSGGSWKISSHKLSQSTLLGFGECVPLQDSIIDKSINVDWSNLDIKHLSPLHDTGSELASDDFFKIANQKHDI
jgi:hypothetical protein